MPAGTLIVCPCCASKIARTKIELIRGMALDSSQFEWIDQESVNGDQMFCQKCHESYFYNGKLHTENGWI